MKRVIRASKYVASSRSSLVGKQLPNDGSIAKIFKDNYNLKAFRHKGNYVFEAVSSDGQVFRINTRPLDEDGKQIEITDVPKNISQYAKNSVTASKILAADEDDMFADDFDVDDGDFTDTLDDVADTVEDIQETVDEVEEDDINIDTENNIAGHYIAECEGCHGVFISATMESDQEVTKVTGICPLCEKETDQYLKWVIRDAEQREDTELEFN